MLLIQAGFKDYTRENGNVLLSYCNTSWEVSPSSARRDFPSAEASLFGVSSETKRLSIKIYPAACSLESL